MAVYTSVQGGTRAGWKIQKPAPSKWECVECGLVNYAHRQECGGCGGARD